MFGFTHPEPADLQICGMPQNPVDIILPFRFRFYNSHAMVTERRKTRRKNNSIDTRPGQHGGPLKENPLFLSSQTLFSGSGHKTNKDAMKSAGWWWQVWVGEVDKKWNNWTIGIIKRRWGGVRGYLTPVRIHSAVGLPRVNPKHPVQYSVITTSYS